MHPLYRRVGVALFATTLLLAACGDDDTTTTTDDPAGDQDAATDPGGMDDMDMADTDGHTHGEIDLTGADVIPTVTLTALPDNMSGVNIRVEVTDLRFAPERASSPNVDGEGHAHVYVDGEKVGRVYGEWYHLPVEPGEHEIRVDLNGNDHSPFVVDGAHIEDTATVVAPEPPEGHTHAEGFTSSEPVPSVELTTTEDAMSGWNLRLVTENFTFAPEKVSTPDTESGQGHAHLYVDGKKITRIYGEWFHYNGDLASGDHELRVELSANDHSPYLTPDGDPIEDSVTVTVEGEPADDAAIHDGGTDDGDATVVEVSVADGAVSGGGRQAVALGDEVVIRVTSDVADEIHVHGYDLYADVTPGEAAELRFVVDVPGVWEIELEQAGLALVELEVS